MTILETPIWRGLREAHEKRVEPWVRPRLERSFRHERHPVEDFLFEYYSLRPSHLLRWHPGIGVVLKDAECFLRFREYLSTPDGVTLGPVEEKKIPAIRWIRDLLTNTESRAGFFGCHGLHEWAMVYRAETVRHADWPLRLQPAEIHHVLESLPVRCSHYDAFRFFTPEARPLNRLQPARESMLDSEQPACLHANMDLYKWAYKLSPFTPSELVAETFELARDIRELDMRASPYDLSALGYQAVKIETPEGREEYESAQRGFAERARPLRRTLAGICTQILTHSKAALIGAAAALVFLTACSTPSLPESSEPVITLVSERLSLSKDVAWAKWADGLPVRDPQREEEVLQKITAQAEAAGLNGRIAERLLRAQIQASCAQQEYWMTVWKQGNGLPAGDPPALAETRKRLDRVTSRLIAEWAAMETLPIPPPAVRARLISEGFAPAAASAAAAGFSTRVEND